MAIEDTPTDERVILPSLEAPTLTNEAAPRKSGTDDEWTSF